MITWDETKRRENLRKHGVDFADAQIIFDGYTVTSEDKREAYGEQRLQTLGLLRGVTVAVVHTERGNQIRVISIRKTTKHEDRFYFSQIPD